MTEPAKPKEQEQQPLRLSILGLQFDPHRLIYSTIILISALSIYNEGEGRLDTQTAAVLSAVIVAPLFALTMAHAFSDALDLQIKLGRRLTGRDRRHVLFSNLEYMYIAVPPLALTLILGPTELPGATIIDIILWLGLFSLFMWGVFAARKAGLGSWAQVRFGVNYAVMGLIIVIVELILTH